MANLTLLSGSFVGGNDDKRVASVFFQFPDTAIVELRFEFIHPLFRRQVATK